MVHDLLHKTDTYALTAAPDYQTRLVELLRHDLDFHDHDSGYASHNYHAFPAKFPPQLPRKFINNLTDAHDMVLDPMVGSGTTVVEAQLLGRQGIGFDIDPLAALLTRVKTTKLAIETIQQVGDHMLAQAQKAIRKPDALAEQLTQRWDRRTRQFVDYWFAQETQLELQALSNAIARIEDMNTRHFFEVTFSGIIITKSGGVSLAFDLAHTRPHRAKIVYSRRGEVLLGHEHIDDPAPRIKLLTKTLRSPLEEFEKRLQRNMRRLQQTDTLVPQIYYGDAQHLPLEEASIDLIVTSPPYIANAIDYMRAHKFSLVWLGYPIDFLSQKRKTYIGGEAITAVEYVDLPAQTKSIVQRIAQLDEKKSKVVARYYSEMTRSLAEMYRVLKPDTAAIVVVGSSTVRGIDTQTASCLAEIGQTLGFAVPAIGVRQLDRDRRMLPASAKGNSSAQIQQRMHEEHVIGFYKA